jgi:hypothetical protein
MELVKEENNCYVYGKYKKDNITKGSILFTKWFKYLCDLKDTYPQTKVLIKLMTSSLWGRLCEFNRKFVTDEQALNEKLDLVSRYNTNHKYYIRNITHNRNGDDLLEIVNCKKPYKFNIARIKPFLLARSREMTAKVAIKHIDDVVRICVDNVTFDKQHDDVCFEIKTFKLTKEDKTTGKMQFRRHDCYRNFANEKYTTLHFYTNILDDVDEEDI